LGRRLPGDAEGRPPDHHAGERALVRLGGDRAPRHAAAPENRDAVGDGQDLAQLVADEDDREAGVAKPAEGRKESFDLLRHEHRGRLVEDQHAAVAVQRLEDLGTLLLPERQPIYTRLRVECDPEALCGRADLAARRRQVDTERAGPSEDYVLGDAHRPDQ
jgi:hypothetical protein